ncbi:unnamed protein product [Euphydryas editha]|uniref:Uncharacterized protein n=1 Tax=Euphydryas editha TaxID=104508 RepID=A0AAU9UKU9_EUPED|nr:unnamed protein product [Euphydryas editha]
MIKTKQYFNLLQSSYLERKRGLLYFQEVFFKKSEIKPTPSTPAGPSTFQELVTDEDGWNIMTYNHLPPPDALGMLEEEVFASEDGGGLSLSIRLLSISTISEESEIDFSS